MREMKETGIEWIGKIPKDWNIKTIDKCFRERNERVSDYDWEPLSVTKQGIVKQLDTAAKSDAHDDRKKVCRGDFVINSRSDRKQSCGLSNYDGSVSLINIVLENKNLKNEYIKYLLKNYGFAEEFYRWGSGIVSDLWSTNFQKMKKISIPIPPDYEQIEISNELDEKIVEIDNIIKKTVQTIEDYKLYKQSIVTKIVTKGLDENVEMKDSGVEWIGEIPKSWKTIKIKYTSYLKGRIGWQGLNSGDYEEEGAFLITGTDFKNGQIEWSTCVHISEERFQEAPEIHIKENDLLITKDGTIGKLAIVKNCPNKVSINSGVLLIRNTPKFKYNKRFLYYVLQSEQFKLWYALSQTGNSTIKHLYQEQFANFIFTYPDLKLQEDIISYLDRKCNKIDKIIYQKENLIEELENYKKSLIYEYVTGKKEVNSNKALNKDNSKGIKINCKDNIFAQAILLCKIIEKLNNYNLGRVKAEKTLYLIEKEVGFDFDNNYVREAAGPLSEAIYKCEAVISKSNKWVKVNKVKKHIEYEILSNFIKYNQYYNKYYSDYDDKIEKVIEIIKNCSTDKAEMIATLYASWNDFIIKKEKISNLKIVKDVRENWNDTKKRFDEKKWLDVLEEMKQIELIPKGNGNLTIVKEQ